MAEENASRITKLLAVLVEVEGRETVRALTAISATTAKSVTMIEERRYRRPEVHDIANPF